MGQGILDYTFPDWLAKVVKQFKINRLSVHMANHDYLYMYMSMVLKYSPILPFIIQIYGLLPST